MRTLKIILTILIFCFLTVLTQVGGIVYLLSLLTHKFVNNWTAGKLQQRLLKIASFLAIYSLATFVVVPIMAKPFGRVPLPLRKTDNLQPLNFLTCFLNRHYVRSDLKQISFEVANQMNKKYPGTTTNYLDANFPFINKFPLFPHLSHNDGKKLDLLFCYLDKRTGKPANDNSSFIGYGICEEPLPDEKNTANFCAERGYWQYSFLKSIIPQGNKDNFSLDNDRTRELVNLFSSKSKIVKIFIEPHLKTRLQLTSDKIRFHGCQAVRHDDHLHVQLK